MTKGNPGRDKITFPIWSAVAQSIAHAHDEIAIGDGEPFAIEDPY